MNIDVAMFRGKRTSLLFMITFVAGLLLLRFGQEIVNAPPSPILWHVATGAIAPLFLAMFFSALGNILVAGTAVAAGAYWLFQRGADRLSLVLYAIAALVSLHYLHISPNDTYTNDLGGHISYINSIHLHWFDPYSYAGYESHHPPLYYYVAAIVSGLAEKITRTDIHTAMRFLSWLCFLVFNAFSLLTMRRAGLSPAAYKIGVTLLLLWPASMHLASKINSEALYYALYAIAFYYAICWYQEGKSRQLLSALLWAGVAFMVRSNAIILFAVIFSFMIIARYRKRFYFKSLLCRRWAFVGFALLACTVVDMGHALRFGVSAAAIINKFGVGTGTPLYFGHLFLLNYDYTLDHPFHDWTVAQSFLAVLLKTAIFGEYTWPWPQLAVLLDVLLYAMGFYALLPWLFARRKEWQGMLPFMLGFAIPVTAAMINAAWKQAQVSQDARFIYPAMLCFVVCFCRSYELVKNRGALVLTYVAPVMAVSFTLLSVYFFWNNAR